MAIPERIEKFLLSISDEDMKCLAEEVKRALNFRNAVPLSKLELVLTEDCPFRCDYCFVEGKNRHGRMSVSTAKAAIDFLFSNCGKLSKLEILLMGGEPLMEFDLIRRILPYANKKASAAGKSITWSITTNGVLVDEEKMEFFQANGVPLLLSIDGDRKSQDAHRRLADGGPTFDKVYPKIALMLRYQPWLGARMTANADRAHTLLSDVQFLHGSGINQFIIGANQDAAWTHWDLAAYAAQWEAVARYYMEQRAVGSFMRMTSFERSLSQIKKNLAYVWGCDAGRGKFAVTANGKIFGCTKYAKQNDGAGRYCFGDLKHGIMAEQFRKELQDNRTSIRGRCMSCDIKEYCSGCCSADNLKKTGSIFLPTEIDCWFARNNINMIARIPGLSEAHKNRRAQNPSSPTQQGKKDPGSAPKRRQSR